MPALISRSISPASIAMVTDPPRENSKLARHVGRQPAFETLAQHRDKDGALARKRQCIAASCPNCPHRHAGRLGPLEHGVRLRRRHRHQIARLVLAEPIGTVSYTHLTLP